MVSWLLVEESDMKKKAVSKNIKAVRKVKKPAMTDEAAGRIALEILHQKMEKEGGSLKYLTPQKVKEGARQLGITYSEAVDFVEMFTIEFTRRMIAGLKKG